MTKKLHYLNINGLAESIRYILAYTKQEFEDVRHDKSTWLNSKIKATVPFGQIPVYEEDGRFLHQSLAIAKYVARDSDLIPADPWLQAVADSAVFTIYDYLQKASTSYMERDPEKKESLKKELLETIVFYFSRFEKQMQENGGYFTGKLSWAEFVLCGVVETTNLFMDMQLEKDYPTVKAALEEIRNSSGVKEHIAARGPYEPLNK